MKKTKNLGGWKHYTKVGLKPITVYVTTDLHKRLTDLAVKEERSLQVTARRILEERLKD